jgi:hypothetical protein
MAVGAKSRLLADNRTGINSSRLTRETDKEFAARAQTSARVADDGWTELHEGVSNRRRPCRRGRPQPPLVTFEGKYTGSGKSKYPTWAVGLNGEILDFSVVPSAVECSQSLKAALNRPEGHLHRGTRRNAGTEGTVDKALQRCLHIAADNLKR